MDVQISVCVKLVILLHLVSITVCDPKIYTICAHNDQCLSLEQFAASTSQYLKNQTNLMLSPGNHSLSSRLNIANIKIFSIISEAIESIIVCYQHSGFYFNNVDTVRMNNITLVGCGDSNAAVINISQSNITITNSVFTHSCGIVIFASNSRLAVRQCVFKHSYSGVIANCKNEI